MVRQALCYPPFESLLSIDLGSLTLKVLFLVAITFGRRLSELGSLSCRAPFLQIFDDLLVLRPGPRFIPKVNSAFHLQQEVILPIF